MTGAVTTDRQPTPSSVPGLDPGSVERTRRLGGEPLLRDLVELLLAHAPDRLASAQRALEDGDAGRAERAVHGLKSMLGNVGALALHAQADALEDALAAGEVTAACAASMAVVATAYAALQEGLGGWLEGLR